MRMWVSKSVLAFIITAPSICFAANDCAAVVTKKSQTKMEAGWALQFDVKTSCESSTGRFVYTYVDDKGKTIERRSPNWTPSDGKNFVVKDEIAEPGGLKSLTVKAGSVESTKSP